MLGIRGLPWGGVRQLGLVLMLGWFSFFTFLAGADETDNFHLPLDTELADLGDFLGAVHTRAIEEAVQEVNAEIERALVIKAPATRARRLDRWHDPDAIASAVASKFGDAFTETFRVEQSLRGEWAKLTYPGKLTANSGIWMNFAGHFPADPRALSMFFQADTVKAYGVYFGADKLTHFHQLGWSYYNSYRSLRRAGLSDTEAYHKVLHRYAHAVVLAESKFFGTISTGVYSNGDMAVNHVGFKFSHSHFGWSEAWRYGESL